MSQTAANQLRSALTLFTAQVSRRLRYTVDPLQYWAVSSVMVSILNSTQIETGIARTRGGTSPRTTKEGSADRWRIRRLCSRRSPQSVQYQTVLSASHVSRSLVAVSIHVRFQNIVRACRRRPILLRPREIRKGLSMQ